MLGASGENDNEGENVNEGEARKLRTIKVALGQMVCGDEGLFSLVDGDLGEGAGAQPSVEPADAHVELRIRFCEGSTRRSPCSDSCTSR